MADDKKAAKRADVHTHNCEWCGRPWECANGPDCELSDTEGHCTQECYDRKTPRGT